MNPSDDANEGAKLSARQEEFVETIVANAVALRLTKQAVELSERLVEVATMAAETLLVEAVKKAVDTLAERELPCRPCVHDLAREYSESTSPDCPEGAKP